MAFSEITNNETENNTEHRHICSKRLNGRVITGFILDVLRRHFSTPEIITNTHLQKYIWSDSEETAILIEEMTNWQPKITQLRPAILVKRGVLTQLPPLSIGDRGHGQYVLKDEYCIAWEGSHTVNCVSTLGPEAENLADEVAQELYTYAITWRKECRLGHIDVKSIGETTLMEESGQFWQVPVLVEYKYYDTWTLKHLGVPLRHIDVKVNRK